MDKLTVLKAVKREFQPADQLATLLNMPISALASLVAQLEQAGLIEAKRVERRAVQLTQDGKAALSGLPERKLITALSSEEEISTLLNRTKLGSIALQWAKKNNWIMLLNHSGKTMVKKISDKRSCHEEMLAKFSENGDVKTDKELAIAKELRDRKLVHILEGKALFVKIMPKGEATLKTKHGDEVTQVTPALVRHGEIPNFRPYNVEADVEPVFPGKRHPLQLLADNIRDIFIGMGFQEMDGPIVESSFWNFDVMFMPQNHPNRDLMDTFFLKQPNKTRVPKQLADIVKQVHLNGWKTGSKGCASEWSVEEAAKPILRTHTTATTFRYLEKIGKGEIPIPCKFFSINRVFRNEAIDKTHLPEFHQIEGFVVADNLNLRSLMGVFTDFYAQLGISKVRFKPVFNPYTEPSMEIFGYHDALSKWVEIGNSGIFRPETLAPFNIKQNVIAWGLALERAAMILFEVDDIRKVVGASTDLQWIRDFPQLPEVLR